MNPLWNDPEFCQAYHEMIQNCAPFIFKFLDKTVEHRDFLGDKVDIILFDAVGRYIHRAHETFNEEPSIEIPVGHMNGLYAVMESERVNRLLQEALQGVGGAPPSE